MLQCMPLIDVAVCYILHYLPLRSSAELHETRCRFAQKAGVPLRMGTHLDLSLLDASSLQPAKGEVIVVLCVAVEGAAALATCALNNGDGSDPVSLCC